MLEEDYLSAIIESVEPSLWVDSNTSITLSMAHDPSRSILANSGGLHDALLMTDDSNRAMSDDAHTPL